MHHPLFFGVLFGVLLSRFLLRRGLLRGFGHGRHGACGPGGAPGFSRAFRGGPRRWRGERWFDEGLVDLTRGSGATDATPPVAAPDPQRLERALGALELSERQRLELDEVLTRLGESVGGDLASWRGLDEALAVIGAPAFDRVRAEAALPHVSGGLRIELVDGLEHAHNVLTPEQREKLIRR